MLEGNTKGYRNHPQLERFKAAPDPLAAINYYLHEIADEADKRGYNFNRSKLAERKLCAKIAVTDGQLAFEWQHLLSKSAIRSQAHHLLMAHVKPLPHGLMELSTGDIEQWERI